MRPYSQSPSREFREMINANLAKIPQAEARRLAEAADAYDRFVGLLADS
jgi:hypothetical protein